MTNNKQISALEAVLADTYTLYLKTQNYHWNITGTDFHQLHIMLEAQYKDLIEPIDVIAERVRSLGALTQGTFAAFMKLKTIEEAKSGIAAEEMISELYEDQEKIIKTLKYALSQFEQANDLATIDILTKRIAAHEKNHWMLGAVLKKPNLVVNIAA